MFPEHFAVSKRSTRHSGRSQQHDLLNTVDGQQLWRAVSRAARRPEPASLAGRCLISNEIARRGDDDEIIHDQRGAGDAPAGNFRASVVDRIARPNDITRFSIECVYNSCSPLSVDAIDAECRCRSWTSTAI